jgi:hypothetical protein
MPFNADQRKHASIFHPYLLGKLDRVEANKTRFVYYTDADTALKIITGKTIWLRQTMLMNDFREVTHGLDCLQQAFQSDHAARFRTALHAAHPDVNDEIEKRLNAAIPSLQFGSYVACFSEHGGTGDPKVDAHEQQFGRLSMWRRESPSPTFHSGS